MGSKSTDSRSVEVNNDPKQGSSRTPFPTYRLKTRRSKVSSTSHSRSRDSRAVEVKNEVRSEVKIGGLLGPLSRPNGLRRGVCQNRHNLINKTGSKSTDSRSVEVKHEPKQGFSRTPSRPDGLRREYGLPGFGRIRDGSRQTPLWRILTVCFLFFTTIRTL